MSGAPRVMFGVILALASSGCADSSSSGACDRPGIDCDVSLPAPTRGVQYAIGPLEVPSGQEVLRCFWRKVPIELDVRRIQIAYNLGSHHLDIFTTPYWMPDGDFDCSKPSEWGVWPSEVPNGLKANKGMPEMVVGFQNDRIDWSLPDDVSYHLRAGQQLLIQSHFANANSQTTPTSHLLNYINLFSGDAPARLHASTLFDEDTKLLIPAGTQRSFTRICEYPQPVSIIGLFTHFHSRGKRFQVFTWDPATAQTGDQIYENRSWQEPPWRTTDSWGGPIVTRALKMVADYDNREDRDISWGYFVDENEHMETYVMSYPHLEVEAECICHREGEPPPRKCP